jgi:hypothetical protein
MQLHPGEVKCFPSPSGKKRARGRTRPRYSLPLPPQQQDAWSCAYHLLHAWALALTAGFPWTPQRLTDACAPMAAVPVEQLVQEMRAQYQATNASVVREEQARGVAAQISSSSPYCCCCFVCRAGGCDARRHATASPMQRGRRLTTLHKAAHSRALSEASSTY